MFLKKRPRAPMAALFPLMRKVRPRRDSLTGETEKNQTPYPTADMHDHKDFNNPKKYPMEIDHIDGVASSRATRNLRWLTKATHIWRTNIQFFPFRRKKRKGAPTRRKSYVFSTE